MYVLQMHALRPSVNAYVVRGLLELMLFEMGIFSSGEILHLLTRCIHDKIWKPEDTYVVGTDAHDIRTTYMRNKVYVQNLN